MKVKINCMRTLIIGQAFTNMSFMLAMHSIPTIGMFFGLNMAFTIMIMLLTIDDDDEEV